MAPTPFSELCVQATSELLPLDPEELQHATALSELVYYSEELARERRDVLYAKLGVEQCMLDVSRHNAAGQWYLVGHTPKAMYVAFQGTHDLKDWAANLSFFHATMWDTEDKEKEKSPAAHGGFSGRSVAVPLEELYLRSVGQGKRLVLCGHSLGGAVALLCTVKILRIWAAQQLGGRYATAGAGAGAAAAGGPAGPGVAGGGDGAGSGGSSGQQLSRKARRRREGDLRLRAAAAAHAVAPNADPNIRCITFAAPAVANEALAAEVVAAGWDRLISNFVQPEDFIVPFVNMLLKAEPGSAALDRTLRRLACSAALTTLGQEAAAAAAAAPPAARFGLASLGAGFGPGGLPAFAAGLGHGGLAAFGAGLAPGGLAAIGAGFGPAGLASFADSIGHGIGHRIAMAGGRLSSGGVSPGAAAAAAAVALRRVVSRIKAHRNSKRRLRNLGVALSLASWSRAAAATAAVAVSIAQAAARAAARARDDLEVLHAQLLEESAVKETAAMMSLALASACNLPAAETLGNAPHVSAAARRLQASDSVRSLNGGSSGDAGPGGAFGPGGASTGQAGGLMPAWELQGGLPTEALVAAAEAGVIGLMEEELEDLAAEEQARLRSGAAGCLLQLPPCGSGPSAAVPASALVEPPAAAACSEASGHSGRRAAGASAAAGAGTRTGGVQPIAVSPSACEWAAVSAFQGAQVEGLEQLPVQQLPLNPLEQRRRTEGQQADEGVGPTGQMQHAHSAGDVPLSNSSATAGAPLAAAPSDAGRRVLFDPRCSGAGGCSGGIGSSAAAARGSVRAPAGPPAGSGARTAGRRSVSGAGMRLSRSTSNLSTMNSCASTAAPWTASPEELAAAEARAEALLARRGTKTLKEKVLWSGTRAAALATPHLVTGAAAATLPAGAGIVSAIVPASVAAAVAPVATLLAPLLGLLLVCLLALPPAVVIIEFIGSLIVTFVVQRTYTIGQQWVLTAQGLEPALKPLDQYRRDWREFRGLGGPCPGHRMIAYRNRLIRLLPGARIVRRERPSAPGIVSLPAAGGAAGGKSPSSRQQPTAAAHDKGNATGGKSSGAKGAHRVR